MRKLELKDIVGYLPYNLMVLHEGHRLMNDYFIKNINAVNVGSFTIEVLQNHNWVWTDNFKPILRPMSDLTKSIVVKGYNEDKEFIPVDHLLKNDFSKEYLELDFGHVVYGDNRLLCNLFEIPIGLEALDLFNQWHFDYRNLIAKGLAIDINTLNQ